MALAPPLPRKRAEPTIALINIVFLMLIFFMVAGSLAPPLDGRIELVDTKDLEGRAPPDAAVLLADGSLIYRGAPIDPEAIVAEDPAARIVPDKSVPAKRLIEVTRALSAAGATSVHIVTSRGLK